MYKTLIQPVLFYNDEVQAGRQNKNNAFESRGESQDQ